MCKQITGESFENADGDPGFLTSSLVTWRLLVYGPHLEMHDWGLNCLPGSERDLSSCVGPSLGDCCLWEVTPRLSTFAYLQ